MEDDIPVLIYLGKCPFPPGMTDFGQLVLTDPDTEENTMSEEEMRKLIRLLKQTVEEVAMEKGPIQWHRTGDKRHSIYARIQRLGEE